jgi:hypothetical protein
MQHVWHDNVHTKALLSHVLIFFFLRFTGRDVS